MNTNLINLFVEDIALIKSIFFYLKMLKFALRFSSHILSTSNMTTQTSNDRVNKINHNLLGITIWPPLARKTHYAHYYIIPKSKISIIAYVSVCIKPIIYVNRVNRETLSMATVCMCGLCIYCVSLYRGTASNVLITPGAPHTP